MLQDSAIKVWFPAVRTGTGTDIFTESLVAGLIQRGIKAEIAWLPLRAEYAPWTVRRIRPPAWVNIAHVNTWLHRRFVPDELPVVATLHHCVQDPEFGPYKSNLQKLYHAAWITPVERNLVRNASKLAAVSYYTSCCAASIFGVDRPEVIHNGVDINVFMPPRARHALSPFRLLFVGSPSRRKGFDLLPQIMRALGSGFELHYSAGQGETMGNLPENMHALPRLEGNAEMASAYHMADALLFPSRLEGFGLVVAEAMASALPVIATNGSALAEVVEDGVTGMLCQQNDIGAFVAAVRRLAEDSALRASMGAAARSRIERLYTVDVMVDRYIEVYESLLSAKGH